MSKNEAVIRETKRAALSLMHNVSSRAEGMKIKALLDSYDPSRISGNVLPEHVKTITFIITRMVRFHGGQTSILHLGTELEKLGFKVCFVTYKPQSAEEMLLCAKSNLPDFRGHLFPLERYMAAIRAGRIPEPDIVVASSWDTVSFTKKFKKSYKMYFVQDYEPLFYSFGEEYLMCRDTYLQGLHMVSLGEWNKEMVKKECPNADIKIDVVGFPCDSAGYTPAKRNFDAYPKKKTVTVAVYLKYYGKRLPNMIPYMLKNTAAKLSARGITLKIKYFGEAKTFSAPGGTNLGQLTKAELNRLYAEADFGMVASMSNISLVPYEMHATGLPVIEFSDGTYPFFFGTDTAILTHIGEKDIADRLLEAMNSPEKLKTMTGKAFEKMEHLSWENTAKDFCKIIGSK